MKLFTYQDFLEVGTEQKDIIDFILQAIENHKNSPMYQTALIADQYDKQLNVTINTYVQTIFSLSGAKVENFVASNNKIASNFFHRLNTQRTMYSLANGVSFVEPGESAEDPTKELLGGSFDHDIRDAAYRSLIHGVTFCFWNLDRLHSFPITEFVPLWDEYDGTLKAGIRFWRLADDRPLVVVLYEIDGYTKYQSSDKVDSNLAVVQEKRAYKQIVNSAPADENEEIVGEENYSSLPIVPLWGNELHQSTLIGMREAIDSYDLIRSGFANDLSDCSQIYWIVENAGGMTEPDLARFRDRLLLQHMAIVDSTDGVKVTPHTQEIPYEARKAYLNDIRAEIYESFGALDVHTVAAGATNDHIDAAYQPMDEEAADFEFQLSECIKQILLLMGIEDNPVFKRNRISNQMEQVEIVTMESQWLDRKTILQKLPNITANEIPGILQEMDNDDMVRFGTNSVPNNVANNNVPDEIIEVV